jgi:hypothetical protein
MAAILRPKFGRLKMAVSERFYLDKKGIEAKSPQEDSVGVRIKFTDTDLVLDMLLDDLKEDVIRRNALFGIKVGVGNSFGGKQGEEAFELAESRFETFKAGNWAEGRQVGPRDSDVILAFVAAKADMDQELTVEDCRARFADDGDLDSKEIAKYPQVKAHIDRIRLERLQARAAKSQEEASKAHP